MDIDKVKCGILALCFTAVGYAGGYGAARHRYEHELAEKDLVFHSFQYECDEIIMQREEEFADCDISLQLCERDKTQLSDIKRQLDSIDTAVKNCRITNR